jgi:hypothetical protein
VAPLYGLYVYCAIRAATSLEEHAPVTMPLLLDVYKDKWDVATWLELSFVTEIYTKYRDAGVIRRQVLETDLALPWGWLTAEGKRALTFIRKTYDTLVWPTEPVAPAPTIQQITPQLPANDSQIRVTWPMQIVTRVNLAIGRDTPDKRAAIHAAMCFPMGECIMNVAYEDDEYVVRVTPPLNEASQQETIYHLAQLLDDPSHRIIFVAAVPTTQGEAWEYLELPRFAFGPGVLTDPRTPLVVHLEEYITRDARSQTEGFVRSFICETMLHLGYSWITPAGKGYITAVRKLYPQLPWSSYIVPRAQAEPPKPAPPLRTATSKRSIHLSWHTLKHTTVHVHTSVEDCATSIMKVASEALKGAPELRISVSREKGFYAVTVTPPPSEALQAHLIFSLMLDSSWGDVIAFFAAVRRGQYDTGDWVELPAFTCTIEGPPTRGLVEIEQLETIFAANNEALNREFVVKYVWDTVLNTREAWTTAVGQQYLADVQELYSDLAWPATITGRMHAYEVKEQRPPPDAMDLDAPEQWPQPAPRPDTALHRQWGAEFGSLTLDLNDDLCMKCGSSLVKMDWRSMRTADQCGHRGFCAVRSLFIGHLSTIPLRGYIEGNARH